MPTSPINQVIQYLRSTLAPEAANLTDGQLLECFVSRREPAALEALVRRHGSMVWGVCRRILQNHHDAEDAFQATFLVLVRRAASIRSGAKVGNWLYGVAHQTALKARATWSKRKLREAQVKDMPEPTVPEQNALSDLQAVLDQELSRLPEKYRTVIVLCDLECKTGKEAARQLSLPQGTVASRLARARVMLANRLARRGLTVPCGTLAAVLAGKVASTSVTSSVMNSTVKAVTLVAAGQAVASGLLSAKVAALTEGVIKGMLLTKLKVTVALAVVLAITGLGLGHVILQTQAAEPPKEQQASEKPKGPKTESRAEARAIIAKAIQALGGETNLAKLKIVRQKGTYRRFIDATQGKTLFSWETITQEPERFKNLQQAEIDGQKRSMTIVFKVNQGWISMDGQTEEMDRETVASTKEDLYADRVSSLLDLARKEYEFSLLAEARVNGRPAVGVKVASKGHPDVRLFFDKETGLLAKRERRVDDGMGGQVSEIFFFSDYQETAKVKVARKIVSFADDKQMAELLISEVQFLDRIADQEFDKPRDAAPKKGGGPNEKEPRASPSPLPPSEVIQDDKPLAPVKREDLTWRPAKVAGPPGRYLVLIDAGSKDEFLPAAEAMAALHGAELRRFDPARLDRTLAELRKAPPRFVVFVLPPEKIDVDPQPCHPGDGHPGG